MNKKDIKRDQEIRIKVSQEEKDLFYHYCKSQNVLPTRKARELLLFNARTYFEMFKKDSLFLKAYYHYLKVTGKSK
jgi:hypothetical protein